MVFFLEFPCGTLTVKHLPGFKEEESAVYCWVSRVLHLSLGAGVLELPTTLLFKQHPAFSGGIGFHQIRASHFLDKSVAFTAKFPFPLPSTSPVLGFRSTGWEEGGGRGGG